MIVDDEPLARKRIRDLLLGEPDVEIVAESSDGLDAYAKVMSLAPDLLFLDIKMPGLSGLELSRRLRDSKSPCVIFTTAYGEHAVDAFDVDAVDYLMKPFDKRRLGEALERVRARLAGAPASAADMQQLIRKLSGLAAELPSETSQRLAVKDGTHLRFLVLHDISHLQSDGDYLHIHTAKGERVMIRERMRDMQQRLSGASFLRISRSALVNLNHVKEVKPASHGDYEFVLHDGQRLTSGKTYRESIRALFTSQYDVKNP